MSTYVKMATDAGDQYLASLAEMQENVLKTMSAFAARFTPTTPMETPPAFAAAVAAVPTAQEVTEASFSFAQKLLKQQKTFAEKMLAASAPATPAK